MVFFFASQEEVRPCNYQVILKFTQDEKQNKQKKIENVEKLPLTNPLQTNHAKGNASDLFS